MNNKIRTVLTAFLTGALVLACASVPAAPVQTPTAEADAPAQTASGQAGSAPLRIVTTIFPEYDWVRNILGDNPGGAEVIMLLDSGVDLHSYQPSARPFWA